MKKFIKKSQQKFNNNNNLDSNKYRINKIILGKDENFWDDVDNNK